MQAVVRFTIAIGLVACGHDAVEPPPPDGPAMGTSGLTIPWTASPDLPGQVGSNITVSSMVFRLDSLRVVGDTGTNITHGALALQWSSGQTPPPTVFSDAPSGIYSKVVFHADGQLVDYSWEIDGTVALADGTHSFAIHDLMDLSVSIETSATLAPGGTAVLGVTFQMDQVFDGLDFTALDNDDGLLVLDTDDTAMTDFRTNLQQSIVPSPLE
ncbi:MAG TPA: hypothetical protein VGG74_36945 [Kofleriaceae bacterium]|jgi:hypothetical protein